MKHIFVSVARNAEVLDQTFSEQFNQPVAETGPDDVYRPRPPPPPPSSSSSNDTSRRRRSTHSDQQQQPQWNNTNPYAPSPDRRHSDPSPYASRSAPRHASTNGPSSRLPPTAVEVPRCQDHGLECVEREVSRDGPNKGRHFFACPLPQGQQCDHFAWADAPSGANAVRCAGHDEPCNERVVKKEGPNKGRTFYTCRRDATETCGFFQFKDELPTESSSSSSYGRSGPSASSGGSPGAPLCSGHSAPCVLRVTRKQGDNFNREFYVCSQQASASCGFFVWKDEVGADSTRRQSRSSSSSALPRGPPPTASSTHGNGNGAPVPRCGCGLLGTLLTCRNGPNQGRTFYKCPQQPQDQQCGFFEWVT